MIFNTKQNNVQHLSLKIDDIIIERVSELNFLGLTLDEHKISQCIGILNRLTKETIS